MTNTLPRIVIHGAAGRMGKALLRLLEKRDDIQVVAAVIHKTPAHRVVNGIPYFSSKELNGLPVFDVAIDFSMPEGFDAILALCEERKAALVSGTTGLSTQQRETMASIAKKIPILWASNFSLGVAVLSELVERASVALTGWDCDIIEMHHTQKKDAPSGTALTLGESANRSGAIPHYSSIRAGDIVGEHTVQFSGVGERVELTHRAYHRDIFAKGALFCAAHISERTPGLWQIRDLL